MGNEANGAGKEAEPADTLESDAATQDTERSVSEAAPSQRVLSKKQTQMWAPTPIPGAGRSGVHKILSSRHS